MGTGIGKPIDTRQLFRPLDSALLELLEALKDEQWHLQTTAKAWVIKDVVAHMLDTKLRRLSIQRDGHFGKSRPESGSYADVITFLNALNNSWVAAADRISPRLLVELHASLHASHSSLYEKLELEGDALFGVAWAGQITSPNWFDIARDYTEYWHHQQQIRNAIGDSSLLRPAWYEPFLDISFRALPHKYQALNAPKGTIVGVSVTGIEKHWQIVKSKEGWKFAESALPATVGVKITSESAWLLLTKACKASELPIGSIGISGNAKLAEPLLELVAVMA